MMGIAKYLKPHYNKRKKQEAIMKHKYQVILVVAALLLAVAVLAALFLINGGTKPQQTPSSTETGGVYSTSSNETTGAQVSNETTAGQNQSDKETETTADVAVTLPDDPIGDLAATERPESTKQTEQEIIYPQQNWTGNGIVLPDDNLEE